MIQDWQEVVFVPELGAKTIHLYIFALPFKLNLEFHNETHILATLLENILYYLSFL